MSEQRPVLIIDAMNAFVRAWAAYPQMNVDGEPIGGCVGFLKTLRKLVNELQPSAVYVAWEGGGSQRRRSIFAEYKLNRRPEKLNRFYEDDIPSTDENRKQQIVKLLGMLKCAPVCQLYVSDCEGDDVIAYLCRGPMKGIPKVVASSDKDLYQLLDEKTRIYSFHKKTYVLEEDVMKEFRVKSNNFALAKALCGDPSDNIPGIKGLGFKTVAKLYPFLGTDNDIVLQDVLDYSHTHVDDHKIFARVVEQKEDVKRNWKLVYLDGGMLSATQAQKIDGLIETFVPRIDRVGLIKLLSKEGIGDFDVPDFCHVFNCIERLELRRAE